MIRMLTDALYSLNKLLIVIAGVYIISTPPLNWIGTLSSSIMVVAALVSIYAIWARKPSIEFVSLWFVCVGLGAYAGLTWGVFDLGDATLSRAIVATMPLILLVARGVHLWEVMNQLKELTVLERRIEDNE